MTEKKAALTRAAELLMKISRKTSKHMAVKV